MSEMINRLTDSHLSSAISIQMKMSILMTFMESVGAEHLIHFKFIATFVQKSDSSSQLFIEDELWG
jgi:hypothetical protein